ncbi:MAG TPA: intradiol ring-cleavage dioxygenase [Solirubrobacteraceae bacterium]|nr:intradiol ring-cleavage dioxygenase [Solirubrobacteraceae bacterium]
MLEPKNDRSLTRRQALSAAGLAGAGVVLAPTLGLGALAATPALADAIALTPEQEEGPFYVDLELIRRDVVDGQAGVPLHLRITILDANTGKPVENAALDIWSCDAAGVYSDEESESTVGETYLRGVQLTDARGTARFLTIYPGHYAGRTTHVHVKVHIGGSADAGAYSGGHVSHTGQMFFPDPLTTKLYRNAPYTESTATRVFNAQDRVYTQQGGSKSVLKLRRLGRRLEDGFRASVTLAVDPSATPAAVGGNSSTGTTTVGASGPSGATGTPPGA